MCEGGDAEEDLHDGVEVAAVSEVVESRVAGASDWLEHAGRLLEHCPLADTQVQVHLQLTHRGVRLRQPPPLSVPARLAKGQGAQETGHNLAHECPKFGHNPACERNKIWAQFCGRFMKT